MGTKIKWDVSGSDPEKAAEASSFASPKPGQYVAKITAVEKKGSGGDESKPMLEVVWEITDAEKKANKEYIGSTMWYYPLLPGHPSYEGFPEQKTDQFLQAVGVASAKKRKGTLDIDKLEDVEAVLIVRAGKSQSGDEYRGEISNVLPYDPESWGTSEDEDEDEGEEVSDDEIEESDDDETESDDDDEVDLDSLGEEADGDDEDAQEKLTELASDNDLDPDDFETWASLAEAIGEASESDEEEDESEDDESEDEGDEEEEEEDEPAPKRRSRRKASTSKKAAAKPRKRAAAKKKPAKRTAAKSGGRGKGGRKRSGFPFSDE